MMRRILASPAHNLRLRRLGFEPSFSTTFDKKIDAAEDDLRLDQVMDLLLRPAFISEDATIGFAIDEMVSLRAGCMFTLGANGDVAGIFTVRDVLRKIAGTNKLVALNKPVADIHTPANRMVYTKPHDKLSAVRMVMRSHGVRNLPVLSHRSGTVVQAPLGAPNAPRTVLGILTHKAMADYASFLADGVGGKKVALGLEKRRGLPGRVLGPQGLSGQHTTRSLQAESSEEWSNGSSGDEHKERRSHRTSDSHSGGGGSASMHGGGGSVMAQGGSMLDVSVGAAAKPHPFKSPDGVANTHRDFGPGQELCNDVRLSEDAYFTSRVHWRSPPPLIPFATYVGVADGVGSWRALGVDPRNFSQRLMTCCTQYLHKEAARQDELAMAEEMPPSKRLAFTPPAPVLPLAAPPLPLGFAQQTPNFWDMGSVDDDDDDDEDNHRSRRGGSGGNGRARKKPKSTTVGEFLSQSLERAAISDSYNGDSVSGWARLNEKKNYSSSGGRGRRVDVANHGSGSGGGGDVRTTGEEGPRLRPPSPLEVLQSAWEMVVAEKVVGSCTACVVSLDQHLNQLAYANLGDSGAMILRRSGLWNHSTSNGSSSGGSGSSNASSSLPPLEIAFLSQQQLHSFNRPYQLGYDDPEHYTKGPPPSFDQPIDANVTNVATRPGDLVVVATDGLFDNVELDEVCKIAEKWEEEWYGGPNEGRVVMDSADTAASSAAAIAAAKGTGTIGSGPTASPPSSSSSSTAGAGGAASRQLASERAQAREDAALVALANAICERARELSLDKKTDSPFALLAKENGILWSGGMPDDCAVVCLRVMSTQHELEKRTAVAEL